MLAKKCLLVGIYILFISSLAMADPPAVHPTTGEDLVIDCLRGTPTIDGDLSDWNLEAMTPAVLDVVEQLHSGQDSWTGPEDCSGEFYMLWDDVNIYIAVVMKDDKLSMNKTGGDIWNADAVEVFFATTNAVADHSEHYQYGFNANNQRWNWCNIDGAGSIEPDYLQIASSVTADGYICEASIEYAQMPSLDFSAGNTIGFHAVFDDTDNGDRELQMTWTGREAHDQSLGFGHMVLSADSVSAGEAPVTIPVPDAGFDDHVLSEGDYVYIGDADYTGAWQSQAVDQAWIDRGYWAADGDLPALSGNNKAYGNDGGSEDYIYQILDETFIEGKTYTLSVWVGEAWAGYDDSWSLYFTGEDYTDELASIAGNGPVGEWGQASLVYTATAADAGKKIGIKMKGAEYVTFEDVTLSYDAGAETGVTITVEEGGDIAAANELAKAGDTIEIAAGTYYLASQIEIKDGVTYRGAGPGLTIIDGNDVTRAFAAWGDRSFNEANENPNNSGPKGWVLEGMTIQNCVADTHDRFSYTGAAFNLKTNFATLDADASGGLNPEEADGQVGGIRLGGADLTEGTEDDDLHRFAHIDTDGSGELSEAELDAQVLVLEDEYGDENGDGGAVFIGNEAVGTIQNCDFLNNHTPIAGDGDDGGAINITGLSVLTINDCLFNGNYACSPNSVAEADETGDADGDGGHIKIQGPSASAITPGTTLIANRCVFLNGNASDDGGAIQSSAVGTVVQLDSCWFEGNTSWDNGNVCQFSNNAQNEVTVTNCIFVNNITKADNSPDRMIETNRNTKFINCTFVGNNQEDQDLIYNNADAADTDADGVNDELADATQVINCIFVNNVVGNGDDVLGSRDDAFTIVATNCLFFGNTLQNGNAADNTQRPDIETGSILSDPLLDADLVPGAGSEAIDGGVDPATVGVTLTNDYNGDTRPQGAGYDIGAFEVE